MAPARRRNRPGVSSRQIPLSKPARDQYSVAAPELALKEGARRPRTGTRSLCNRGASLRSHFNSTPAAILCAALLVLRCQRAARAPACRGDLSVMIAARAKAMLAPAMGVHAAGRAGLRRRGLSIRRTR
jgi:hypothetical protein